MFGQILAFAKICRKPTGFIPTDGTWPAAYALGVEHVERLGDRGTDIEGLAPSSTAFTAFALANLWVCPQRVGWRAPSPDLAVVSRPCGRSSPRLRAPLARSAPKGQTHRV